jgi:RimJ/RimL family protein N-acetyltransferase
MQIRRCDDLELLRELDLECFPADERLTEAEFVDAVSWVAYDPEPVGFLTYAQHTRNEGHLVRYGVTPSSEGHGVGALLVKAMLRYATGRARRITTYVLHHNIGSLRCLIRSSFTPYAPGENFLWLEAKCR